ncbi:MAG TPA: hypothetical protein VH950_14360 [Gaiellaceae bacterium]
MLRGRRPVVGAACAAVVVAVAATVVLAFSSSSRAEPTRAQYLKRVAAICRVYGPRLDRIRPPDVAEPANVIAAITAALPLIKAQERRVRALEAPASLRDRLARWFRLQDRRRSLLEKALRAAGRQDFRALSIAYVDFILAGPATARLGSAIGIPHPPC